MAEPKRYRKTATIEAIQLTDDSYSEVVQWVRGHGHTVVEVPDGTYTGKGLSIITLEGRIFYPLGYWIARNPDGEFYGIDAEIFSRTYAEVPS